MGNSTQDFLFLCGRSQHAILSTTPALFKIAQATTPVSCDAKLVAIYQIERLCCWFKRTSCRCINKSKNGDSNVHNCSKIPFWVKTPPSGPRPAVWEINMIKVWTKLRLRKWAMFVTEIRVLKGVILHPPSGIASKQNCEDQWMLTISSSKLTLKQNRNPKERQLFIIHKASNPVRMDTIRGKVRLLWRWKGFVGCHQEQPAAHSCGIIKIS